MDNHGYDDPEDKQKNNNSYSKVSSLGNGACQPQWSNGGPE